MNESTSNSQLSETLIQINNSQETKDTYQAYKTILLSLFHSSNASIQTEGPIFLSHLIQTNTGLIISRPLISEFLDLVHEKLDLESKKKIFEFAIQCLSPRLVSFEEQVSLVRERLAALLEEEGNLTEAAQNLIAIPLDSGHRVVSEEYKLKNYIHIVQLLLTSKDAAHAETYLNRAGFLLNSNHAVWLHSTYKYCQAQILTTKQKFLDAALKYFELSLVQDPQFHQTTSSRQCLHQAVVCAILAKAGPSRSKFLATLYKDERVKKELPLFVFLVLEKMHLGRILKPHEVHEFSQSLMDQMAYDVASDGTTPLQRAMIQHNLLSASLIYTSISFEQLGVLLDILPSQAENIALKMITEGRLQGTVDRIDGYIDFPSKHPLHTWDQQIEKVCRHIDEVLEQIGTSAV